MVFYGESDQVLVSYLDLPVASVMPEPLKSELRALGDQPVCDIGPAPQS